MSPFQTHLAADASPLPAGEFTRLRVELFPFAQPFRAGSRLRITVDAPGGSRPLWAFDTIADGERVEIAADRGAPLAGGAVGRAGRAGAEARRRTAASLRSQPCRDYPG